MLGTWDNRGNWTRFSLPELSLPLKSSYSFVYFFSKKKKGYVMLVDDIESEADKLTRLN
jgi:hypothetical protein